MAPSADPGVSTRSVPPPSQAETVSPSLGSPPDPLAGVAGLLLWNQGRQRPPKRRRLCFQLAKRLRTRLARGARGLGGSGAGGGREEV